MPRHHGLATLLTERPDAWGRLRRAGLVGPPVQPGISRLSLPPPEPPPEPAPIGPWRPCGSDAWEIPGPVTGWDGRQPSLARSSRGRRRIALVGESVATGFTFSPGWRFADTLREGLPDTDVIDLARPGLEPDELLALLGAVLQLELDAVVLFAGNNWWPAPLRWGGPDAGIRRAAALEEGGWAQLRAEHRADGEGFARAMTTAIADLAARVPVVVVVPEVALHRWPHPWWTPAWLAAPEEWLGLARSAEAAAADERWDVVASTTRALVSMAGGASPRALQLAGLAARAHGRAALARGLLEAAVDVGGAWGLFRPPQCPPWAQDALAGLHGACSIVDLRRALAAEDGLPDDRAFLDYCHLDAWGMLRAAAAVCRALSPSGSTEPTPPPADVIGAGRALAAAHCGALGAAPLASHGEDPRALLDVLALPPEARAGLELPPAWEEYLVGYGVPRTFAGRQRGTNASAAPHHDAACARVDGVWTGGAAHLTGPERLGHAAWGPATELWWPAECAAVELVIRPEGGARVRVGNEAEVRVPGGAWSRVTLTRPREGAGWSVHVVWELPPRSRFDNAVADAWSGGGLPVAVRFGDFYTRAPEPR